MASVKPRRILVVADEGISESRCRILEQRGFEVTRAAFTENGYQELLDTKFDLVVVELDTPDATRFIKQARNIVSLHGTLILAIGEWGSGKPTVALTAGADAFEPTPIDDTRLIDAIERILNKRVAAVGLK